MKRFLERIKSLSLPWYADLLLLIFVGLVAYGLLISRLGFYWDDWAFIWIAKSLGPAGIARYFATDSNLYGWVVQLFTSLLGTSPIVWHIFGLFWRLMSTFAVWELIRLIWPGNRNLALWVSLFYLVFPGFIMQFIPVNFGFFFLFATIFIISLIFNILAVKTKHWGWLFFILSMLFSLINLLAWEYFFTLELIRPIILWLVLAPRFPELKFRFRQTLKGWFPNLLVFLGVGVWRAFFNTSQTARYQMAFFAQLKVNPGAALLQMLATIGSDFYKTAIASWGKAFRFPSVLTDGIFATYTYIPILLLSLIILYLFLLQIDQVRKSAPSRWKSWPVQAMLLGILMLFLAGWPFWLANIPLSLVFPNNRFLVPFILGTALILAGVLGMLVWLPSRWHWISTLLVAIFVAFSIGSQFLNANDFRHDWDLQKKMFWQLIWRAPSIKAGTLLLSNKLPSQYDTDNSLTAPLNWIYAPGYSGGNMPYMLLYPSTRLGNILPGLKPGIPISRDYRAASFAGNTSQTVAFTFSTHSCLHILDPQLDPLNPLLPEVLRKAAQISSLDPILDVQVQGPPINVFGKAPPLDWCYYFEKADLARQQKKWDQVVELGDSAFGANFSPEDPMEYVPFIAGYAHTGNWDRAVELTTIANNVEPQLQHVFCSLWHQIVDNTPVSQLNTAAVNTINDSLSCHLPLQVPVK